MNEKTLNDIVASHKLWLENNGNGEKADLSWADLRGANLFGADLRGANLAGTDLFGADLTGANLTHADLRGASLTGANLTQASLTGANLTHADLRGANLRGAGLIVIQLPFYTAYIQKEHTRIGCKYYSNEDWRNFSDDEISKMATNALEFWSDYKAIIFAAMDSLK